MNHKASPRHPSLASIFRIKQKNRSTTSTGESSQDSYSENYSASRGSNVSAVDLDAAICSLGDGIATIKGRNGLENAKEVHMHLNDFVKDTRALLDTYAPCGLGYSFTYLRPSRTILFQSYSARIQCFFSAPFLDAVVYTYIFPEYSITSFFLSFPSSLRNFNLAFYSPPHVLHCVVFPR